jgi:hypothetical protein
MCSVKPLGKIIEEHQQALANIEQERAEKARLAQQQARTEADRRAKGESDRRAKMEAEKHRTEVANEKLSEFYSQIEAWVKNEASLSFETKPGGSGATLSIDSARIDFQSGAPSVSAGLNISNVPWGNVHAGWEHISYYDGGWFLETPDGLETFDQPTFNRLVEGWLKIFQQAQAQKP